MASAKGLVWTQNIKITVIAGFAMKAPTFKTYFDGNGNSNQSPQLQRISQRGGKGRRGDERLACV
jgi:hypothetical protein